MHSRNIIHARARLARNTNFILAITPSAFLGAGRGREYEIMSSREYHVKHHTS